MKKLPHMISSTITAPIVLLTILGSCGPDTTSSDKISQSDTVVKHVIVTESIPDANNPPGPGTTVESWVNQKAGNVVPGQDHELRTTTESFVETIDSRAIGNVNFRNEGKSEKKSNSYLYSFKFLDGNIAYIARRFSNKDSLVIQRFYMNKSALLFSTELITYYYGKDSIHWGARYYFSNNRLKDHETLGHGKSEIDSWDPEKEVLSNFEEARQDVQTFLKE